MTDGEIEKYANQLARLMKGANDYDGGDFAHFFDAEVYGDCSADWVAICDRAEALAPSVVLTSEEIQSWRDADRYVAAEAENERRQLGCAA